MGTDETRGEAAWFETLAAAAAADEVGLEEPPLRVDEPWMGAEDAATAEDTEEGVEVDVVGVSLPLAISLRARCGWNVI